MSKWQPVPTRREIRHRHEEHKRWRHQHGDNRK
jgi:hypothetical protein